MTTHFPQLRRPEDVKIVKRVQCICRCAGARCRYCNVWLTKHDDDEAMAMACALTAQHECGAA